MTSGYGMMELKQPQKITLTAGTHYICQCGLSNNRPFCDGSHKGSSTAPYALTVTETKEVWLCGCLQSKNLPYCDGTHSKL